MGIISDISKKRWSRGLFKRHVASDATKMEASGEQGSAPEHTASLAGAADIIEKIEEVERLQGVWLEPDDAASVAKSYMGRRRILKPVFTIGRRGALVPARLRTAPDMQLSEKPPYTISRWHCAIESHPYSVVVRDLESHFGTTVDGVRLGRGSAGTDEIRLERGEHSLILGRSNSLSRFRLIIR